MTDTLRPELGDFSSIVCFRALVGGVQETLGERAAFVALRSAGRKRGTSLIESLGMSGKAPAPEEGAAALDAALGPDGTKLCRVRKLERVDEETFKVYLTETICSAGEPMGADTELSFTFGALHGALEALYDIKLRGKQVESVLRGSNFDTLEFVVR